MSPPARRRLGRTALVARVECAGAAPRAGGESGSGAAEGAAGAPRREWNVPPFEWRAGPALRLPRVGWGWGLTLPRPAASA